jgi:chorismate synthase
MTFRFGSRFRVEVFGSSHGPSVGAVIDGVPSGTPVDAASLQRELDRRRPVGRRLATRRHEEDRLVLDEGVRDGRATGGPIRGHVANEDADRSAYRELEFVPRPGHADLPARLRFGPEADLSGGGIFSGRMTVGLVLAGAIAKGLLGPRGIEVAAWTRRVGEVGSPPFDGRPLEELASRRDANEVGCPDEEAAVRMEAAIAQARREGDSVGGEIEARALGLPVGLGEPFFDSIEACLAHLFFSVPAVKGVEFGDGFGVARLRGSEDNDPYDWIGGRAVPRTNHAGGILGGLATGAPLVARVAVKPTASIARPQESVDLRNGERVRLVVKGRHDPCIVPRAVVVVEACVAIGLAELGLRGGFLP